MFFEVQLTDCCTKIVCLLTVPGMQHYGCFQVAHSTTTIQATGAESLKGGRETKGKKHYSGFNTYKALLFLFPNMTQ